MILKHWFWGVAALAVACAGGSAHAQRAEENAVVAAEDAFGTRVGNENSGLYTQTNARGFNPQQAGNVRLFGLYFDQQAFFGPRIVRTTTMRIGLAAQSYPFPAPTGIVELGLYTPGEDAVVSVGAQYQWPVGHQNVSLDIKQPIIPGKLGMVAGAVTVKNPLEWRGEARYWAATTLWRWTPTDSLEFIPYFYHQSKFNEEVQPSLYTAGAFTPPLYDRDVFFGQQWADRITYDTNYGGIARWKPRSGPWQLQAGLFRSINSRSLNHVVFFRNIQRDGTADLDILRYPRHANESLSGEMRATGIFTQGATWRHTVHLAVRGRDTLRLFGGGQTLAFGRAMIGVDRQIVEPTFTPGVRDRDKVTQIAPGVTYVGQWANVGEISVGLQKSFYDRDLGKEGAAPVAVRSRPWLYNGTLAFYATKTLALYAGYTRGLEEFGTAPDSAVNRGEPMPAAGTEQIDGGIRYRIAPGMSLVAGLFEVKKPYFERNAANVFTQVGNLRHRGVEFSFTGGLAPGLNVVAGAMLLKARVSGQPVDQGVIGPVPAGTPSALYVLNAQYSHPSWGGFQVDATISGEGAQWANRINTLRLPSKTTFGLAARYPFRVPGTDSVGTVRAQVSNLTNRDGWVVEGGSGRFSRVNGRSYTVRIAADF